MTDFSPWPLFCQSCQDKRVTSIIDCEEPAIPCPECNGSGLETRKCRNCDSSGWENCKDCNGTGQCTRCGATGTRACAFCHGSGQGRVFRWLPVTCKRCSGKGHYECYSCNGTSKCDKCDGKGKKQCQICHGSGSLNEQCFRCRYGKFVNNLKFVHNPKCSKCRGVGKIRLYCKACESDPGGIKQMLKNLEVMAPSALDQDRLRVTRHGEREPFQFQPMTLDGIAEAFSRPSNFRTDGCTIFMNCFEEVITIQRIGEDQFLGMGWWAVDGGTWSWDLADKKHPWSYTGPGT